MLKSVTTANFMWQFKVARVKLLSEIIIQQIVTMSIYGKEALNICHPYMTDILRYT